MRKLLIASTNSGKIREIKDKYGDLNFQITGISNYPELDEVEEDGNNFKENALKKARIRAEETGLLTLADDSGLEVDYLNGEPGVYSARYAGEEATDADNNKKLVAELKGVPAAKRGARFRTVVAIIDPETGEEITVEGKCEGRIADKSVGSNGFGYDPLFYIPQYKKTMAQLPLEVKNSISHRARALKKARKMLIRFL